MRPFKGEPTPSVSPVLMCGVCHQPMKVGQLRTGIQVNRDTYYHGHYLCVRERLGPELTQKAVAKGLLPAFDPASLLDGKLPKYVTRTAAPGATMVEDE